MKKLKKNVVNLVYNILIVMSVIGFITTLFYILNENEKYRIADKNYEDVRALKVIPSQSEYNEKSLSVITLTLLSVD